VYILEITKKANFWANNPNAVLAILAETRPKYIWLSIGGDDILGSFLAQHGNFSAINEQVLRVEVSQM
jgi:hypothetical protein